jgi:outer membrane protein TolC
MRVKQESKRKRWREASRNVLSFAAALLLVTASDAQTPIRPTTSTPNSVRDAISVRILDDVDLPPLREATNPPHVNEASHQSIEGTLVTTASSKMLTSSATPATTIGHRIGRESTRNSARGPTQSVPGPITHGPFAGHLDAYRARANELPDSSRANDGIDSQMGKVNFGMWWQKAASEPLGLSTESLAVDVAGLTQTALISSPFVQSILTEPQIRRNDLVIADSEFDSLAFVEAKFADKNEPIGSTLTTGTNDNRFRDETFSSAAGLRKKSRHGGALEIIQHGGYQENNSIYLIPNPQGTTRLEINFTQPLLKDHGRAVNNTRVLLAKIDLQLAISEVRGELEEHLTDVTRAYWELFQSRAEWLQRNRLLEGAVKLHDVLQARSEVDSQRRQILRAQVAVTSRRSDLIRAETRIRNAQARLRLLTGDPLLIQGSRWELLPQDEPLVLPVQVSTRQATLTALDNRPDIAQSIRKIQAVSARVGAAKNQVLPRLDLILSTYVAGLEDKTDTFGAFGNQFKDGRPSYAAGLQFEIPIGNRASRARLDRNRWELTRALYDFQQNTEVVFANVEVAVRETHTSFDEMKTKKQAIDAASREVSYLEERWRFLPDQNESAVLLIENLLDAQERLADQERAFVQAQVAYAMSWVQLRKAMGVLLRFDSPIPGPGPPIASEGTVIDPPMVNDTAINAKPIKDIPIRDMPLRDTALSDTPLSDTPLNDTPLNAIPLSDTAFDDEATSEGALLPPTFNQALKYRGATQR